MLLDQARRLRGKLPAQATGFVGREVELTQLTALLGSARLVTVTGPAGIGKTRLALRAAVRAAPRYPNGVCLVELSTLHEARLLPAVVAAALGLPHGYAASAAGGTQADAEPDAVPEPDAEGQLDAVLGHLCDRKMLLFLDTCEHLIDACARLTVAVLRQAPGATVLATSRQPFDVLGEHCLLVPPLPLSGPGPGVRHSPALGGAPASGGDAIELFAQRAASVVPGFAVSADNRADVIALCRRLDGIPLAIELAAVRLRALPIQRMAGGTDDRFRVLTGSRRTAEPRHQTLRAAIDWSHDLCSPAERAAWARLSAFAGSFDIAAAADICAGDDLPGTAVMETVISLVDKSVLLRETPPSGPTGLMTAGAGPAGAGPAGAGASGAVDESTRYRLLGTFREYGAERLAACGAQSAVHARYIARYRRIAETFGRRFIHDQRVQLRVLHREHENLMAALRCALARTAADESAVAIATALGMHWFISGQLREGRQQFDEVVRHYPAPSRARAQALAGRAFLTATTGDIAPARADAEAAIEVGAALGDAAALGPGYVALHRVFSRAGDLAAAAATADLAIPVLEAADDILGLAQIDIQDGLAHLWTRPETVPEICARGRRRLPDGELWATSYLLGMDALARFRQGDYESAAASSRTMLGMKRDMGDVVGMACGLGVLGFIAAATGRFERAAWLLGAASPLWEHAGYRYMDNPLLEELHPKSVRAALGILGERRYAELRDRGAARPLEAIVALAITDASEPEPPGPMRQLAAPLTSRELQIAALVTSGLSNRQIAERMAISKRTVDAHVDHIFGKLSISSRVQLTLWLKDWLPQARHPDNYAPPQRRP